MEKLWSRSSLTSRDVNQRLEALEGNEIRMLSLFENEIEIFPNAVGGLASLSVLILNSNSLQNLGEMLPRSLTRLYVASNLLTSISAAIGSLVQLQRLDVSRNRLTSLPDLHLLTQLERLDCHGNELRQLPNLPSSLELLGCFSNVLTVLPVNFDQLTSLNRLNCAFNVLQSLKPLPENLVYLNAEKNQIRMIDFTGLQCLEKVDLSDNEISSIEGVNEESLSAIRFLKLSGNRMRFEKLNSDAQNNEEVRELFKWIDLSKLAE